MPPKLYMMPLSAASRSVLLLEQALGLELEHKVVDLYTGDHLKPDFLKLNPQHTIPVLEDDDGTIVLDSHVIMNYLITKYAEDNELYPKDFLRRLQIDEKLHFDSGTLFPVLGLIVNHVAKGNKFIPEAYIQRANLNYDFLNTFLKDSKWIVGDELSIADFSVISTVTSLNILVPINKKFENIWNYLDRAVELPYYEVNQKGLVEFAKHMSEALK